MGLATLGAGAYPLLYFENIENTTREGTSVDVTLVLSEKSYLDVRVPFEVDPASTASIMLSDDDEDNDFWIEENDDEDLGYTWDPETGQGVLIFDPGTREFTISVSIASDDLDEDTETVLLKVLTDEVTVARPVGTMTYTLSILDGDAPTGLVEVTTTEMDAEEGDLLYFNLTAGDTMEEDLNIAYQFELVSVDEGDFDLDEDEELTGTATISEDSSSTYVTLQMLDDLIEESEEVFIFRILSAVGLDSGDSYPLGDTECVVTVTDNDPVTAGFNEDYEENTRSVEEGTYIGLVVTISGSLPEDLEIPLQISGTATRGEDEDDTLNTTDYYIDPDYLEDNDTLLFESGDDSVTIPIYTWNDDLVESTETINITLGTPVTVDSGTVIEFSGFTSFSIEIEDNDPVKVSFGRINPDYDAYDTDSEEPRYIPVTERIIKESDGQLSFPVYLSAASEHDITFDLTLESSGTTATSYDNDLDADEQDWDYLLQTSSDTWQEDDRTHEVTIYAGYTTATVHIGLNDDQESALIPGQAPADDIEDDDTIRLSIGNLDTESTTAEFGTATSIDILVKEMPDIDVTDLFREIQLREDNWTNGQPPLNRITGLHELGWDFLPPESVDGDLTGYRSYKISFDLTSYDPDYPASPGNDSLKTTPAVPETYEEFEYYVYTPFRLRYPTGTERIVLQEGDTLEEGEKFLDHHADIATYRSYILWPLDLPVLEPEFTDESDQTRHAIDEAFSFNVDFRNSGVEQFPVQRLDLDQYPDSLRIYLSAGDILNSDTYSGSSVTVYQLVERDDGGMMLEIDTSSVSSLQIQYLDDNGGWRVAHPAYIYTQGSRLFWTDRGPPTTDHPPSEVNFRIYRVIANP